MPAVSLPPAPVSIFSRFSILFALLRKFLPYGLVIIAFLLNVFSGALDIAKSDLKKQEKFTELIKLVGVKIFTIDTTIYDRVQELKALSIQEEQLVKGEGLFSGVTYNLDKLILAGKWLLVRMPIIANVYLFYFILSKVSYILFVRTPYPMIETALFGWLASLALLGVFEVATIATIEHRWSLPFIGFKALQENFKLFLPAWLQDAVESLIS